LLSIAEIQQAYEKYRTSVAVLEVVAFILVAVSGVMFLSFLSAFEISMFFGFAAAILQILSG
jgi:hypothetical protein